MALTGSGAWRTPPVHERPSPVETQPANPTRVERDLVVQGEVELDMVKLFVGVWRLCFWIDDDGGGGTSAVWEDMLWDRHHAVAWVGGDDGLLLPRQDAMEADRTGTAECPKGIHPPSFSSLILSLL